MGSEVHPDTAAVLRYMNDLKGASDIELLCHAAGWKEHTPHHQAIKLELARRAKKREQRVAWAAIGISVVGLVISITALVLRLK